MKSTRLLRNFMLIGLVGLLGVYIQPLNAQGFNKHRLEKFRILHHQRLQSQRFAYQKSFGVSTDMDAPAPPATFSFVAYGKQFDMDLESNEHLLDNLPKSMRKRLKQSMQLYKGKVNGMAGTWARVNRTGDRISGAFWDGNELFIIDNSDVVGENMEPVSGVGISATPYNLVYKLSDTQTTASCALQAQPANNMTALVTELKAEAQALALANKQLDLAIVADSQFTQANSTNPQAAVIARMNVVDGIYSEQVGVHLNISEIRVLATNGGMTSTSPSTLLDQFASYTASSGFNNPGLAHLFTGRDLDGSTVGIAYISVLCRKDLGIGLSQTTGTGIAGALTVAHEIGHNFGAPHDGQFGSACATTPTTFVMSPVLNGSTQFSGCSLQQMATQVSQAACLTNTTPTTPTADVRPVIPVNPINATINSNFNFNVEVKNSGTTSATSSTARISLPTGVAVNSVTTTLGQCQVGVQVVNCSFGNLPTNATSTVSLNLKAGATPGNLVSNVQVSASNDSNTGNNAVSVALNIVGIVTPAPSGIIFQSDFNTDNGGFSYIDDAFRGTKQPSYASGSRVLNATDGKLEVLLGGRDNIIIKGMSGGWRRSFTLTKPQTISLSFEVKVDQTEAYESNEWSDALLALDGRLVGLNGGDYLLRLAGNGEGGLPRSSGRWRVTITRGILPAGIHTITLGGYNNQKDSIKETTRVQFDNVKLIIKS
jgi:Metallo-peptidase family M12/Domain of unknown function DUF11